MLFGDQGEILLSYRRVNPQWHARSAPEAYAQGRDLPTAPSRLGRIAIVLCGDLFDDDVVGRIQRASPSYLLVPMSRSYARFTREWWDEEEKREYGRQVGRIGITTLLVNSYECEAEWPAFGGAMIVSAAGEIIAETPPGEPSMLVSELPAPS